MTNIANWKISIFNGKKHYFNGDFQQLCLITRGYGQSMVLAPKIEVVPTKFPCDPFSDQVEQSIKISYLVIASFWISVFAHLKSLVVW